MTTFLVQEDTYNSNSLDYKIRRVPESFSTFVIDFKAFFGVKPQHVSRRFSISLSDLSYQPKIYKPRADWAVTAAFTSFEALQASTLDPVQRFATIGTGSGTDAIAALDVFPHLRSIVMTDLHDEVVDKAKINLMSAAEKADGRVRAVARDATGLSGHSLVPLKGQVPFDLIYENLPNIPLPEDADLLDGQTSSTYFDCSDVSGVVPSFVSKALLDLHYVCLLQARTFDLLTETGVVLSSIGGRVPIDTMLQLADAAGFTGRILSMSWKVQSEPDSVIEGYATQQEKGLGPFYFYRVSTLRRIFGHLTGAEAGLRALEIENELRPDRLDAVTALKAHKQGIDIGHPVVVMASTRQ
ncbi:hypothetical protein CBS63078_3449 [Aspergillus niger]|uniref:Contig An18c0030, genomic contig n=3 Tax=Aspergillus niger TaxID=5061 RepID=A2R9Z0_ASPNC|nr:uncharacterized protein BO96DRAFT_476001 [Aspergillus niger CBS 101883]XP_059602879.1 uncharacterized protein An18g00710 [Aspergillus niger]RDH14441.1 hypothetical protein M747DRAFT_362754 [Aspergillus niger ATCC 13496]KAI2813788.1 hypothetical protein CBS115989_9085 [Aspergillus niger]KAI2843547.1 hypothetical protein CBS11232_8202 [Aspergillus niger]KAI2847942.1 hypothetical protein CBS11350_2883 [Aspergillus niger]KAI2859034.1 hypothetical protein CBS12448_5912 [Aspergillus niger]